MKKNCPFQHSINLIDLNNVQRNYKKAKFLCLYLMKKKVYNEKNPALFFWYAYALMKSGKSSQDYLQSEKYFLKSLSVDDNFGNAHNSYASLLSNKFGNYDTAEYHYNQSLTINPNNAISHANFAEFLITKMLKYDEALSHCETACELEPKLSWAHYVKALSLFQLNRFDESLKEYQLCMKLDQKDRITPPWAIKRAKTKIKKIEEEKISPVSVSTRKNGKKTEKEFENEKNKYINIDKEQHVHGNNSNETNGEIKTLQQQVEQLVYVQIYRFCFNYYCYCGLLYQITFFV